MQKGHCHFWERTFIRRKECISNTFRCEQVRDRVGVWMRCADSGQRRGTIAEVATTSSSSPPPPVTPRTFFARATPKS